MSARSLGMYFVAAAAKSLQSRLTLWDPIDSSPPGSAVPGILQARTLEGVAISFSNAWKWKVKVKSLSRVWLAAIPWTAAYQAPPSMGFSRWGVGCHCLLQAKTLLSNKSSSSQSYGFSSSHVWMRELNSKESQAPNNWCFRTVVLEITLENPLDCKKVQPDNPKGNQSWVFIGKTDAEAETTIFWPPDEKNWLIGKAPDAGIHWRGQQRIRWLDIITDTMDMSLSMLWGVGDGQGSLACCSPWLHKESDMTEWLNWSSWKCSLGGH